MYFSIESVNLYIFSYFARVSKGNFICVSIYLICLQRRIIMIKSVLPLICQEALYSAVIQTSRQRKCDWCPDIHAQIFVGMRSVVLSIHSCDL
jgi:hypothetical protein